MKPTILRDRAITPDGQPLTLHEHDGVFTIRVGTVELMSNRQHHSEERLAELACASLRTRPHARVLIGGLGMGFTLRAALGQLAADAEVAVVELMPAVIRWNRTPDYGLGADALADPRVAVIEGDVVDVLRDSPGRFDAVILDVDNGASGLSVASNDRLYSAKGLLRAAAALRPGGCLAVWSADADPAFADRLGRAGFAVTIERARVHAGGGGWTTLFLGRLGRPR
jgi:spermidine synthase